MPRLKSLIQEPIEPGTRHRVTMMTWSTLFGRKGKSVQDMYTLWILHWTIRAAMRLWTRYFPWFQTIRGCKQSSEQRLACNRRDSENNPHIVGKTRSNHWNLLSTISDLLQDDVKFITWVEW
ncbi:MAG: hypothetical protein Ct9H90mP1_0460 [Methanobacteriota archaeon]|nr:MAG: hypothetical protein Ct9H90mP1_0460 [Euryarchaeota archaeon]